MSVQAGIWNFTGLPVDCRLLSRFADSLAYQGPDGCFSYLEDNFAMLYMPFHTTGESRLERQPHTSRNGYVVTWDGRLDNREQLINDVGSLDSSSTDVTIVTAALDRWGDGCLRRFTGDWAISVWRPAEHELTLASDYMAVRHLYYSRTTERCWWATDLSPLALLTNDKLSVDDDFIAGYFANDPDADLTPYRGISQVPPGQFVRIREDNISVQRYWSFNPTSRIRYKTDNEYEEHFRHVFRQAVERRLRSDAPILAELSGGLDSSSIVCMADDIEASQGRQTPCLRTLSFYDRTEPAGDDWNYFPVVERRRGQIGFHIDVGNSAADPEPLTNAQSQAFPGYLRICGSVEQKRAEIVREGGYRAVLSGLGGDEFMGGVPDPAAQLADLILQFHFPTLATQLINWSLAKRRPLVQLLGRAFLELMPARIRQHIPNQVKIQPWLARAFVRRTHLPLRKLDVPNYFGFLLPSRRSYIASVVLMSNKLAKLTPPAFALEEMRYPYLDQDLIEFMLSIPAKQLLRPGERRSLLRRALAGIVPAEILSRRTKQFGARTPALALEKTWTELMSSSQDLVSARLGYIEHTQFKETLSRTFAGQETHIVPLLRAISLELWLRDIVHKGYLDIDAEKIFGPHSRSKDEVGISTFPSKQLAIDGYPKKGGHNHEPIFKA